MRVVSRGIRFTDHDYADVDVSIDDDGILVLGQDPDVIYIAVGDAKRFVEELSAFAGATWVADSVHLMRSHLPGKDHDQVRYESLKTWSLRQSSGGGEAGRSASGGPQGTP